ncbi:hypothetical protein Mal15_30170 [Stieleria maiorica]|uniref:Uncharacterized protein n=1 Tax=Stieleria maiorica TaxID=2795974 RepID=A0A5B9MEM0_9BACT|nr:hypothetical protein [Stieleria maiorica]QEF98959.1 hypothetical protein Mal15_30170 [Stieleria maiorica]
MTMTTLVSGVAKNSKATASKATANSKPRVRPSTVDPRTAKPFTLDQELEPFGTWTSDPILVPPKDASKEMAETMLRRAGIWTSKEKSWAYVQQEHRGQFTQVRELELTKASIRLPKSKLFFTVTEQQHFDKITDPIPACVQTRLDEFLAGPGRKHGVKVYYLKPLCIEVDDELVFTPEEGLRAAINKVQEEVYSEYRRMYLFRRPQHVLRQAAHAGLAMPRAIANRAIQRRQKAIDAYQAKLEFQRRKTALRATRTHQKNRTDGCTFDEMLALTNPLQRHDVIEQYGVENELSRAKRDQLIRMAAGQIPWFVAFTVGMSYLVSVGITIGTSLSPPVMVCDPAFVAELPGSKGQVLKIGHFDEVGGVTHVEI